MIFRAFLIESSMPWATVTPMLDPALAGLTCKHTNINQDSSFWNSSCKIQRNLIDALPQLFLYPCPTHCFQTTLPVQIFQHGFPGPVETKLR